MDCPERWVSYLPWAEFAYNTSFHEGSGTTPFELVYGRTPPSILSYIEGASRLEAIDQELRSRDELLKKLKSNLLDTQARMKSYIDRQRTDIQFQIGDLVFVKLQPYR